MFGEAEFDAYTGSKISSIDIGAAVVRMSYSPTSGHAVIAILEVGYSIIYSNFNSTKIFSSKFTRHLS